MPRSSLRRIALTGALGGLLALTGCSAAETNGPPGAVQLTPLSDTVVVSQPYCTTEGTTAAPWDTATRATAARATPLADPGCEAFVGLPDPDAPDDVRSYTTAGGHHLLVAVQVTDGTPDPVLALRRRPDVRFVQDPAVLADTQDSEEAPAGRHWVGYRSGEVRFAVNEPDAGDVVDATVAIPRTGDRPASEAVETTIAIGAQVTANGFGAEFPADRPVDCHEDLSATPGYDADLGSIACPLNDGGDGEYNRGDVSAPQTAVVVPTDAAIATTGGETTVPAGGSATVPFTVSQSGGTPEAADLALSASTSVPGGQASPSVGSVPWATTPDEPPPTTTTDTASVAAPATVAPPARTASGRAAADVRSADVGVSVAVPAGTPGGVYDVTLKAQDQGGSRSATARIRVPAAAVTPDAVPPAAPAPAAPPAPAPPTATRRPISATVQLLRSTTVSRRTRRVHVGRVTCVRDTGSCLVRTRVRIGSRSLGGVVRTIRAKSSSTVTLRLTRANLARLIARRATATTTVSATGSADILRTTTVEAKALPRKRR